MTTTILVFLVGALVMNLVVYGGVTWVYFADKHRMDPPRRDESRAPGLPAAATEQSESSKRLSRAA